MIINKYWLSQTVASQKQINLFNANITRKVSSLCLSRFFDGELKFTPLNVTAANIVQFYGEKIIKFSRVSSQEQIE